MIAFALAVAFAWCAVPAYAATSFEFRSRGFGHGLGMSQYGAKGFAERGFSHEHILRHYYGNAGTDPKTRVTRLSSEPTRDVNLDKGANYGTGGNNGYTRAVWTLRPGYAGGWLAVYQNGTVTYFTDGATTFTASGGSIIVKDSAGKTATYGGTISAWGSGTSPNLTQVKEGTGQYNYEYVRFRGELLLSASAGKIKLVNRVSMRDYLYGVVPRESPASWHIVALKAQTVAARSYSLTSTRSELYTTTSDQVYGGHSRGSDRSNPTPHEHANSNAAVDATFGQVVTYDGTPIRTYFMSTSGGHTENNENVWGSPLGDPGDALPYIRGVPDPYELASGSPYHGWSSVTYSAADARTRLLGAGVPAADLPATISAIRIVSRGVSGRPRRIEITGTDGRTYPFTSSTSMDRFRNAFGIGRDRWLVINPRTYRIAGADRYETSVAASKRVFSSPATVIVASGDAPADALTASGLAGAVGGAPILLTKKTALHGSVAAEIARLSPSKVYVIGGTGVVADAVLSDIRAIGSLGASGAVERLGGPDRYDTARLVALKIKERIGGRPRAIVVSGESLVDAVASAGLAYARDLPIILVRSTSVPAASSQAMTSLGVATSLVVGGSGVVSDGVLAAVPGGQRIAAGADRYETAALLATYVTTSEGFNWGTVYISSGSTIVDALSAGPVAGHNRNPMLFAHTWSNRLPTHQSLAARKSAIFTVQIVGGEGALSGWQQGQIDSVFD